MILNAKSRAYYEGINILDSVAERRYNFDNYVYESSRLCFPLEVEANNRCLMIFTTYLDESGTHKGSQNIVLAGYAATREQWETFEPEWKSAISNLHLNYFHMTDFANRAPPYDTWPPEKFELCFKKLVKIINAHVTCSVGLVLPRLDYDAAMGKFRDDIPSDAYGFLAGCLIYFVPKWLSKFEKDPQVAYVVDRGASGTGTIRTVIDQITSDRDIRTAMRFLSIRAEDKELFVPLQAADILAYELYRFGGRLERSMHPSTSKRLVLLSQPPNFWSRIDETMLKGAISPLRPLMSNLHTMFGRGTSR